ncbi:hypothetical protein EV401DRAFT_1840242, partial [Pisolithus croceorrhizus]
ELKGWLARLLSCPDAELMLETPLSTTSSNSTTDSPWTDIFDGTFIWDLKAYNRKPFLHKNGDDLCLIFSLAVDSFNPFGMKIARGTSSVTGIYMACLNLPPDI